MARLLRSLLGSGAFFQMSLGFLAPVDAAVPGATFNGRVSEIFFNGSQVLLVVSGTVDGTCAGKYGAYNLAFDMSDLGADVKLTVIRDAFNGGKKISGTLKGCGSSNINKLSQLSVF
jgi:hypothetical protein